MKKQDESLIEQLSKETKWTAESARLGLRANFHCEYCDLDFLASPENYKLIQIDHIVPLSIQNTLTNFDNLALACKQCNFSFKRGVDPRSTAGKDATRDELIQAAKEHIRLAKAKTAEEIAGLKAILNSKGA